MILQCTKGLSCITSTLIVCTVAISCIPLNSLRQARCVCALIASFDQVALYANVSNLGLDQFFPVLVAAVMIDFGEVQLWHSWILFVITFEKFQIFDAIFVPFSRSSSVIVKKLQSSLHIQTACASIFIRLPKFFLGDVFDVCLVDKVFEVQLQNLILKITW